MKALVFGARRDGYSIGQVLNPMTVGELKNMLADMEDSTLVILSHDNGYTYGSLSRGAEIQKGRIGEYGSEWTTIDEISI